MGKALVSFSDFVTATRDHQISGPEDILNDATRRTWLLRSMLTGRSAEEVVQGGTKITERIQLTFGNTYSNYKPNDVFTPTGQDSLTPIEVNWRFSQSHYVWNDQEIELNEGNTKDVYKRLKKVKEQSAMLDMWEGMENSVWSTPDTVEMETNTGGAPYSLRAFITEDGLAPSSTNGGVVGANWTTVETVTVSSSPNWRNQVENYTAAAIDTTLLPAFDAMWLDVQFESPETKQEYVKDTRLNRMKIFTNKDGATKYAALTRNSNDRLVPTNDPGGFNTGNIVYNGIPIKYVAALDSLGYAAGQPRFWWMNFEFIYPIFHSKRYMYPIMKDGGVGQPYTHVLYRDTWWNLFCKSRRRQGIIVPA